MTKAPLNILRTDIEDVAEAIKLRLMTRDLAAQVGVDSAGDVSIVWAGGKDVPAAWLVGTYTRKAKVDDIEFDLVERLRELQASRGKQRVTPSASLRKPRTRRTATQQPTVKRRLPSESALGCIPAPAAPSHAAPVAAPARGPGPMTVDEFRRQGGVVQVLPGVHVAPTRARPAWKAAA